jgi:peptide/nickel transport system permease protein
MLLIDLLKLCTKYLAMLLPVISLNYILARGSTSVYTLMSMLEERSPGLAEALARYYGLNTDPFSALPNYLLSVVRGDLGLSIFYAAPVSLVVAEALSRSLSLLIPATAITIPLSIIILTSIIRSLGTRLDRMVDTFFIVLMAVPEAVLAILFSIYLPPSFFSALFLLVLHEITFIYVFTRRNIVSILSDAYEMIEYYLAMGYRGRVVVSRELLRLSIPLIASSLAYSIATATPVLVFIETVFNYPGLGYMMFLSLIRSDYPLASGCFLVLSSIAIGANMVSDYINGRLDWRLKLLGAQR